MPTMIQRIATSPIAALTRKLKARAALAGMSLSDYLLKEIEEVAQRPTIEEMRARLARRSEITAPFDSAEMIREERERR